MNPDLFPPNLPPPPHALPPRRRGPSALLIGALAVFALLALAAVATVGTLAARRWLPQLKTPSQRQQERVAVEKLNRAGREVLDESRRQMESGNPVEGITERMDRLGSALGDTARQFSGDERKVLEAGQRLLAGVREKVRTYEQATTALKEAGFFNPDTLPNRPAIAARRELLKAWAETNEALVTTYAGLPAAMRTELRNVGLAPAEQERQANAFEASAHSTENLRIRELDRQIGRLGEEMLVFLDKEWGQWKVQDGGRVLFNKTNALKRFDELQRSLKATADTQIALQRQMLDRATRQQAPGPGEQPPRASPGRP